jgi:hypothetical protein
VQHVGHRYINNSRVLSNFFQIHRDIRKTRCTTGINHASGKFATTVKDTGRKIFTGIAGVTLGKFATGVNDTSGKLPPVSPTPVANNGNSIRLIIIIIQTFYFVFWTVET